MTSNDIHEEGARPLVTYWTAVVLLFSSILLGGATSSGYFSDLILQLISIPAILVALWYWPIQFRSERKWVPSSIHSLTFNGVIGWSMSLCATIIFLVQYIPVFGELGVEGVYALINANGMLMASTGVFTGTSSIEPAVSRAATSSLLPPLTLFLLVSLFNAEQRSPKADAYEAAGVMMICFSMFFYGRSPAHARHLRQDTQAVRRSLTKSSCINPEFRVIGALW